MRMLLIMQSHKSMSLPGDSPIPDAQPTAVESPKAPPGDHMSPDIIDSVRLLNERGIAFIRHGAETYRLCSTRQGKLILTK